MFVDLTFYDYDFLLFLNHVKSSDNKSSIISVFLIKKYIYIHM